MVNFLFSRIFRKDHLIGWNLLLKDMIPQPFLIRGSPSCCPFVLLVTDTLIYDGFLFEGIMISLRTLMMELFALCVCPKGMRKHCQFFLLLKSIRSYRTTRRGSCRNRYTLSRRRDL